MTKILLTSVLRPFSGPGEGASVGAELFHAQVTRAQGIFSFRQVIRCWAIDYIAHNLQTPCVVLHYPSEKEFVRNSLPAGMIMWGSALSLRPFTRSAGWSS